MSRLRALLSSVTVHDAVDVLIVVAIVAAGFFILMGAWS